MKQNNVPDVDISRIMNQINREGLQPNPDIYAPNDPRNYLRNKKPDGDPNNDPNNNGNDGNDDLTEKMKNMAIQRI